MPPPPACKTGHSAKLRQELLPRSTPPAAMASDGETDPTRLSPLKCLASSSCAHSHTTCRNNTGGSGALCLASIRAPGAALSLPLTTKHPQPRGSQGKLLAKQKACSSATDGPVVAMRPPSRQSLFRKGRKAITAAATGAGGASHAPWRQTSSSAAAVASTSLGRVRALVAVGVAGGPPVIA